MKLLFMLLLFLPALGFAQSTAENKVVAENSDAQFLFTSDTWDYGNIPEGVPAVHTFEFTSTGKEPVIVSQVAASCGCTTPVWTKEPVPNGKKGIVAVTYNAARLGSFVKTVTVLSNTGEPKYLTVKGNVIPNPNR